MQERDAAASTSWQARVTQPSHTKLLLLLLLLVSRLAASSDGCGPAACRRSTSALPSISSTAAPLASAALTRTLPKPCRTPAADMHSSCSGTAALRTSQ